MKNVSRVVMGVLLFAIIFFGIGFVAAEMVMQKKINIIRQKIPQEWWHGGWDETAELQRIIGQRPMDKAQSAQAQYFIASQYYANRDHQRAIQEYRSLINTYPNAWLECQKAQFEIGQVHMYRLNQHSAAVYEYRKVIDDYPDSFLKAMAQMMIGRAHWRQNDYGTALLEYEKVITLYPRYRTEVTEASLDIGDMKIEQAFSMNTSQGDKEQYLREALLSYRRAYASCPLNHPELMERALDGIYRAFRCLDMNLTRANRFIKFQKYGKARMDGQEGTDDDLTDPLEEI